jgi:hypothetical protein
MVSTLAYTAYFSLNDDFSSIAQCAIRMFAQKHLYGYVMSAILAHMVEDALFVVLQVCRPIALVRGVANAFLQVFQTRTIALSVLV